MRTERTARGSFAVAALGVLSACTAVGPNYERPPDAKANLPAASAPFLGAAESVYSAEPVPLMWWRLFHDPNLNQLVEEGLRANTDLRVASANLRRAQASLEFSNAAYDPVTTLSAAPGYGRRSAEEELIPNGPLKTVNTYALGASASYQLDLFGQISRAVEAAQADVFAAQAARDAVRVSVAADVTRAYLDACSAGRELLVANQLIEVQSRTSQLTTRLDAGGRGTSLDTVRSFALEDQVRANVPALQARRQRALYQLAVLLGRPPSEMPAAAAQCDNEPVPDTVLPVGDGAALLRRRPDIRRAEAELRAAVAQVGVATSDLYPKVTLGASFGSVGLTKNLLSEDTLKFSVGPLITWQFPDRRRVRARIDVAEADVDAAYARFDASVLLALRETESALVTYARDLDTRALLVAARDKSQVAATKSERLYQFGRAGFLPVLDANRALLNLEQTVAAADSTLSADRVALFLALGGGWETPDALAGQ